MPKCKPENDFCCGPVLSPVTYMVFPADFRGIWHVVVSCVMAQTWINLTRSSEVADPRDPRCKGWFSDFRPGKETCFQCKLYAHDKYANAVHGCSWRDKNATNRSLKWVNSASWSLWNAWNVHPRSAGHRWSKWSNAINNGHIWPYMAIMAVLTSRGVQKSGVSCLDLWCTGANWFLLICTVGF